MGSGQERAATTAATAVGETKGEQRIQKRERGTAHHSLVLRAGEALPGEQQRSHRTVPRQLPAKGGGRRQENWQNASVSGTRSGAATRWRERRRLTTRVITSDTVAPASRTTKAVVRNIDSKKHPSNWLTSAATRRLSRVYQTGDTARTAAYRCVRSAVRSTARRQPPSSSGLLRSERAHGVISTLDRKASLHSSRQNVTDTMVNGNAAPSGKCKRREQEPQGQHPGAENRFDCVPGLRMVPS